MSPEPRDHSFDELTRGLASGTLSRGKALRLMGAALVGGTLASIPGIAWGAKRTCKSKQCRKKGCVCGTIVGGGDTCLDINAIFDITSCAQCPLPEFPELDLCLDLRPNGLACTRACPA
jgi:hypothetical protein